MNTKRHSPLLSLLCLASLISILALSGCLEPTQVHDVTFVSPAGELSNGALVSHLTTDQTGTLSLAETLDFMDAELSRTCVPVPGLPVCADDQSVGTAVVLPARGAALALSSADMGTLITTLDVMCRDMGNSCTYAQQAFIKALKRRLNLS